MPGPCSDDYICLLVRFATKNKKLRRKRITIEKLCGMPVLFIGAEQSEFRSKQDKIEKYQSEKPDSQIIKFGEIRFGHSDLKSKKKKKRRNK